MKPLNNRFRGAVICAAALMLVACDESEDFLTNQQDAAKNAYSIVVQHEEEVAGSLTNPKRRPFATIFNVRMAGVARILRFTMADWDTTLSVADGMRSSNGIIVIVPRPIEGRCNILGDDRLILKVVVSRTKPIFYRVSIDTNREVVVNVDDYFESLD